MPSNSEQIESLIHDRAYYLTIKYSGRDEAGRPKYKEVFTVTRGEVLKYVKQHYRLYDLPFTHSVVGNEDGLHLLKIGSEFKVYYQERGICFHETIVESEEEAWKAYVDHMLRSSATGLKWE